MILFNNQLLERSEIQIDIEDRGYQFGDGVYEVIRVYHGQPFYLEAHLQRLARSAKEIKLALPYELDELSQKLHELLSRTQLQEGIIYLQISRGVAPRAHPFPTEAKPVLVAYTKASERPHHALEKGVQVITTEDIRWLRCDIKSLNLLGAVLAKQNAVEQQAAEAILLREGIVTEASAANVFIVHEGIIWTHPANHLILNGITRQIVLELATKGNIQVKTSPFRKELLHKASECFITGTTTEICPVIQIDQHPVGDGRPGVITKQLQYEFEKLIH